jgi:hypothetical protein
LERRHAAASRALDHWLNITETHGSLIQAFTGGTTIHAQLHYPEKDLVDPRSGTQCYYHCHRGDTEHGHLHLFRRPTADGPLSHLIAISLDRRGLPVALFTVNRWVSADRWLPAADSLKLLRGVSLHGSGCDRDLSHWLIHFLRFYHPVVQQLLLQRDQCLRAAGGSLEQLLEDRDLEILSFIPIDWSADLAAVEAQRGSVAEAEMGA